MERCKVLGDDFFSHHIDPLQLQEIFQTPFPNTSNSNNKKKRKRKTDRLVAHQKNTLRKQVVVEY